MMRILALGLFLTLCFSPSANPPIDAERICRHIEILASDAFEGREIATPGEQKTLDYIVSQFKEIGLEPGVEESFLQPVHLARFNPIPPSSLKLESETDKVEWRHGQDYLLVSKVRKEKIEIPKAELVYAGFGIYAPEIGWDDYKGVDVKGKIVVMLSGVPADYTDDEELWKGDPAAEIYSKSFYKKAEARSRGAIGIITVFKQSKQGFYSWENLIDKVGVNDLGIAIDSEERQLSFSILLSRPAALNLFNKSGYKDLGFQTAALKPGFKPHALGYSLKFNFINVWEDIKTHNVAGVLPGSDLADEVMIYSAHWDHVGILPGGMEDSIRNGAVDNASGTAALIELARLYKEDGNNRRSILFLATGAEESGLFGAIWYNAHPIFPIGKTIANFNMDAHYPYGRTSHITGVVYGRSELDPYLEEAARRQNRTLVSNEAQNIAANIFFRSDHWPFIENGIPSEFAVGFGQAVGHNDSIYQKKMAAYAYKYHQPSDEYQEDFDCKGIAEDAFFTYTTGRLIDNAGAYPKWYPDQPFYGIQHGKRHMTRYFKDVTETHTPRISTQGRTMDAKIADIDLDGDLDIVLAGEFSFNILLMNDGNGKFIDETAKRLPLKRHDTEDIAIEDFNNDGFPDLFFVSEDDQTNEYYQNDGKGCYADLSFRIPVTGKSNAVLAMDVNADGYPDLLIGNDDPNFCLINDKSGGWINTPERIPNSNKTTQDLESGDIDGDGDLDIICGNENGNEIWINDGDGNFEDVTAKLWPTVSEDWETREADLGDVDGDGDLDLFLANVNFRKDKDMQNRLFLNNGKGRFKDVTSTHLPFEQMHTVDGDFIDLDGDGDLDILTSNSFGHSYAFYLNSGDGKFQLNTNEMLPASVKGDGIDAEAADLNGDGKIDLYLCNFRGSDVFLLGK